MDELNNFVENKNELTDITKTDSEVISQATPEMVAEGTKDIDISETVSEAVQFVDIPEVESETAAKTVPEAITEIAKESVTQLAASEAPKVETLCTQPVDKNTDKNGTYVVKRGLSGLSLVSVIILCAIVSWVVCIAALAFIPVNENSVLFQLLKKNDSVINNYYGSSDGNYPAGEIEIIGKKDSVAEAVYAKAVNSVIGISVVAKSGSGQEYEEKIQGQGSGVIYSEDGLIITNYHVIDSAVKDGKLQNNYDIRIYLSQTLDRYYEAKLIGYDSYMDIALLKIEAKGLRPIKLADYSKVKVGQIAIVIGSPGGLDYMNSISEGIVSGIDRDIETSESISFSMIQTTAAMNPGNSGGALLNSDGELMGICVLKIVAAEFEGMGFAINSDSIKNVIKLIEEDGIVKYPRLGITIDRKYNEVTAKNKEYPEGTYVDDVEEKLCADLAGMKKGDIITEFNGNKIKDFSDLKKGLNSCKIGQKVKVKVFRPDDKKIVELEITLGE